MNRLSTQGIRSKMKILEKKKNEYLSPAHTFWFLHFKLWSSSEFHLHFLLFQVVYWQMKQIRGVGLLTFSSWRKVNENRFKTFSLKFYRVCSFFKKIHLKYSQICLWSLFFFFTEHKFSLKIPRSRNS